MCALYTKCDECVRAFVCVCVCVFTRRELRERTCVYAPVNPHKTQLVSRAAKRPATRYHTRAILRSPLLHNIITETRRANNLHVCAALRATF